MNESRSNDAGIDIQKYEELSLEAVVRALPKIKSQSDMEAVINLRKEDLGNNPKQLFDLLKTKDLYEKLNNAVKNTGLIELLRQIALDQTTPLDQIANALPYLKSEDDIKAIINLRKEDFDKNPQQLLALLEKADHYPEVKSAAEAVGFIESVKQIALDKTTPLEQIVRALPHLKSQSDIEAVMNLRKEDFSKDPKQLIALSEKIDRFPKLNSPAENIDLITLINQAKFKASSLSTSALNPKNHEKDPIDKLVAYIINSPETASHFFSQSNRQKQLANNSILIAQMLAQGTDNLHYTLRKENIVALAPKSDQPTLNLIKEIYMLLNIPSLSGTNERGLLKEKLKNTVLKGIETEEGIIATSLKKDFSEVSTAVKNLFEETKETIKIRMNIDAIGKDLYRNDLLRENKDVQKKLESRFDEIKQMTDPEQKKAALANLHNDIKAAIKTEALAQAKEEAKAQSSLVEAPKRTWQRARHSAAAAPAAESTTPATPATPKKNKITLQPVVPREQRQSYAQPQGSQEPKAPKPISPRRTSGPPR